MRQGLDVLLVHLNPWRLVWPQDGVSGAVWPGALLVAAWTAGAVVAVRRRVRALIALDVVLAHGVCAAEAAERNIAIETHATHLIVHGVLHLLGYDHAEPDEEKEMFALQRRLLEEWVADQVQTYRQDLQTEKDRRLLDKSRYFDAP